MIIPARNLLTDYAQPTYLSNGEVSGAATLRVRNINGFSANYAVQIGATGENTSEIVLLGASAPSGTALSLTGTVKYNHPADAPVFPVKFDQVIFYRSTSGTAGAALALGTINITPSGTLTGYDDTAAASTYAYKTAWYNSVTAETSSQSDWMTPGGPVFYSLGGIRQRIKDKLFDARFIPTDGIIDNWTNEWLEKMSNAAIKVNQDFALGSTNVTFSGTADTGTITVSDFKQPRRVWMTSDGVNYYEALKMSVNDFVPQQVFDATEPYFFMYGDTMLGRRPNDVSGTAAVVYYQNMPVLQNDGDQLPLALRAYTQSFVDYGYAQALNKDNRQQEAGEPLAMAKEGLNNFVMEQTPRSQTNQTMVTFDEFVTGDDVGIF